MAFKISGKVIAVIKEKDNDNEKLYLRIKVDENKIKKIENSGAYSYYIRLADNNAPFNEYPKKVGRDEELDAYYVDLELNSADQNPKLSLDTLSMTEKKIEIEIEYSNLSGEKITIEETSIKKIKIYE